MEHLSERKKSESRISQGIWLSNGII